jgi:hypothetical protein
MARALKNELLAVLKGSGRLAQHVEWNRAERALLKRWADDWTDNSEYAPLGGIIEADAHKLGGRRPNAGAIFQELIWYTITAWQTAKAVESGDDPFLQKMQVRRTHLLRLAKAAEALAKYYRDMQQYQTNAPEILKPLLEAVELRLLAEDRPITITTLPLPAYSIAAPSTHLLAELHERQAKIFRRADRELFSTIVISNKAERRVLKAFVHRITEYLGELCGTRANGLPHRKIIAMLANICFPEMDDVDGEDVRKMLDRRARR